MKKIFYLVLSTAIIGLMTSCVGDELTSSSIEDSITSSLGESTSSSLGESTSNSVEESSASTSSSLAQEKSLDEMLKELNSRNITYHSDYQIYYYPVGKPAEKKITYHYDVQTKFDDNAYESLAYLISGEEKNLAVHTRYEKGENDIVVEKFVDLQNVVQTRPVVDYNDQTFKWEESVYVNQISKLLANEFAKSDVNQYVYNNKLQDVPLSIIHGAIPLSTFDLETFKIVVKDNKIDELIFVEKEDDTIYPNSMYGRIISLKVEDIGTTSIKQVASYPVNPENDALGLALEELKTASNYTVKSSVVLGNEEILMSTTKLTESDAVKSLEPDFGGTTSGVHKDGESEYAFEKVENQLVGTLIETSDFLVSNKPKFGFSKDIFTFVGEVEGKRDYEVGTNYIDVLDDIVFLEEYSQAYAQTGGNITFSVKDNHLTEITFPTIVQDTSGQAIIANLRIQYLDINTTTIDSTYWDNFVIKEPQVFGDMMAWDAPELEFNFELTSDGTQTELMTPSMIFDLCLSDPTTVIPSLVPGESTFEIGGNYSQEDQCVYLDILVYGAHTEEVCGQINIALLEAGYTYDDSMIDIGEEYYENGEVSIAIVNMEGDLIISFILPAGEFATA